jgi:hypothetical protein
MPPPSLASDWLTASAGASRVTGESNEASLLASIAEASGPDKPSSETKSEQADMLATQMENTTIFPDLRIPPKILAVR